MKKAIKKIVGIITTVIVSASFGGGYTTVKAIQIDSYGSNSIAAVGATSTTTGTLNAHYATNPDGKCGKEKTITSIDDFTSDMLIAQGAANDDARVYRIQEMGGSMHEKPLDTYALYGAWDDNNVYLMWIMTNVTDVEAPDQNYPISDNGKPWNGDLCQMMLFNVDPSRGGSGASSGTDAKSKLVVKAPNLWNVRVNFETKVDKVALIHSNNSTSDQKIVSLNEDDEFDIDKGVKFNTAKGATTGSRFIWKDGLPKCVTSLWGMQGWATNRKMGDMLGDTGKWVDYLTTNHSKAQDTTYLMTIPLTDLGITKDYITSKGIGLMHITTMGLSGLDSVPYDMSMNDVAEGPCPQDPSTSAEKDDFDVITAPLASLGKIRDQSAVTVSKPSPTITTDAIGAQPANKEISFKTDVFGGEGPYTYQYYVDGVKVGEETNSADFKWTPTAEGDYTIKVLVKDSKGSKGEKEKKITVAAGGSSSTGDTTTPKDPIKPGDTTTPKDQTPTSKELSASDLKITGNKAINSALSIKAAAAGGDGNYKYKFSVTKDGTKVASKAYASTDTFAWTPNSEGTYEITATVKDGDGKEVEKTTKVTIGDGAGTATTNVPGAETPTPDNKDEELSPSLSVDKKGTQKANTTIRFTGKAVGGAGQYKYTFNVKSNGKNVVSSSKSSTSYFDWTPTEAGTYTVAVTVTDASGASIESPDQTITITKNPQNTSTTPDIPQVPAKPVQDSNVVPNIPAATKTTDTSTKTTDAATSTKKDYNNNSGNGTNTGDVNSILPLSAMILLSVAGIVVKSDKKKEQV